MFQRIKAGTKLLLGLHNPGRTLQIFPDDVFLVSFPKSGNTWTRFLIANLLHPETSVGFANIAYLVPDVESTAKRVFDRAARPRVIKSHHVFLPEYPRVIYIVRDPRDVAISGYHFRRKRGVIEDQYPLDLHISRFVAGETSSYGSWGDNVASWLITRKHDPRFLLLRYEDMIADTARELSKIAAFLNIPPDLARISHAVDASCADSMRKLEKAQADFSGLTKTRKDLPFVRAAKAGGWKKELPLSEVAKIEKAWGPLMRSLGYELNSCNTPDSSKVRWDDALLST